MTVPVSAYLLTCNNEGTVENALRSLGFAAEIVVVDSLSTDSTVEIVRRHTDRVIQRPWPGFRDQYQFAHDQCRHEWAVFIDADEEISPALAAELPRVLAANAAQPPAAQMRGYSIQRRTFFMDRWIRHGAWVPDREVRLYRRPSAQWRGGLHAKVHVDGPTAELAGFYYHFSYRDIADELETLNRYSTTGAEDLERAGRVPSWLHAIGNPLVRFLREYVLKGGWRDGFPGLVIALNDSHYAFCKYAKLWERRHCTPARVAAAKQRDRP